MKEKWMKLLSKVQYSDPSDVQALPSNYCTISTDRSHLVMRDAHSSLTLMFTTSGDV